MKDNGLSAGIYGMGFIGAAVYFIGHATTFWLRARLLQGHLLAGGADLQAAGDPGTLATAYAPPCARSDVGRPAACVRKAV